MLNELYYHHAGLFYSLFSLFALAIGSLLNVVIHRLPLMLKAEYTSMCHELLELKPTPKNSINLFFPRSFCPHCKTPIHCWNNIPLLSYVLQKGRCTQCKRPISWRYPFIEALCLCLSLLALLSFGLQIKLLFALLFIYALIPLCFIDLDHQLLPDSLNLGLLWIGLIANTQALFTPLPNAVLSAAGAYLSLWLFIQLFYLLTSKQGMGHGDFKLFAAFGAWFGWTQLPIILLISSSLGALVGLIYLHRTKQSHQTPIPFGPFLCMAGLISLFYGEALTHWYFNLMGI